MFAFWINIQDVLGKFPRYTFHVGRLPGKDVSILTEELDERTFLFDIQVRPNGGGLRGIAYHKFHQLGFYGVLEGWGGVRNLLLRRRHLRGKDLVASEDEVVHAVEGDHLKGHAFLAVIINIVKSDLKCDAPKGPSLLARNYAM